MRPLYALRPFCTSPPQDEEGGIAMKTAFFRAQFLSNSTPRVACERQSFRMRSERQETAAQTLKLQAPN